MDRDWQGRGAAAIWIRRGLSDVLSLIGGVDARVEPELLAPIEEDFYALNPSFPMRVGLAFSTPASSKKAQGEVAVNALYDWTGTPGRSLFGVGASLGLYLPIWKSSGARVQWHVDASQGWWSSSILVGTEWKLGEES